MEEGLEEDLRSAVAVERLNMHRGRVEEGSQRGNKEGRKRDNVCFSTKPARLLPCSITLHRMLHTLLQTLDTAYHIESGLLTVQSV